MAMRTRTISRTSRVPIIFYVLSSRNLIKIGWKLVKDIIYYFFYLQFETRRKPEKRDVVYVDHPLDSTIPFRPGDVKKYMFFIPLWMKSISFYRRSFGKTAEKETGRFLDELRLLYKNAGYVYNRLSSTTRRPGPSAKLTFYIIHLTDPHLHCVPSLHVAVVLYNYLKMREMLSREEDRFGEYESEIEYCRREALAIIDTILTVKQHSINCVSAGLFFINTLHPEFTRDECRKVCSDLLSTVDENISSREDIREYTLELFNWFTGKYDKMEIPEEEKITAALDLIVDFLKLYNSGELELGGVRYGRNNS